MRRSARICGVSNAAVKAIQRAGWVGVLTPTPRGGNWLAARTLPCLVGNFAKKFFGNFYEELNRYTCLDKH